MRLGLALLALLLALPVPGLAQNVGGPSDPNAALVIPDGPVTRTYGTTAKTFLALTPWDFRPLDSTVLYQVNNTAIGQTISRTGGASTFKAPLHLPAGALVTDVGFVFCDTNPFAGFTSFLITQPRMAPATATALVSSTASDPPGCKEMTRVLDPPIQISNSANSYQIEVNLGAADTSIQLASARVGFRLQVSPPGAQVFDDVPPGHPFFQFIGALASAGITGGCNTTPPLYCPDDVLTRGQMAVFLSRALGLHFAP